MSCGTNILEDLFLIQLSRISHYKSHCGIIRGGAKMATAGFPPFPPPPPPFLITAGGGKSSRLNTDTQEREGKGEQRTSFPPFSSSFFLPPLQIDTDCPPRLKKYDPVNSQAPSFFLFPPSLLHACYLDTGSERPLLHFFLPPSPCAIAHSAFGALPLVGRAAEGGGA